MARRFSALAAMVALLAPTAAVAQDQPVSLKLGSAPTNNISPMQMGIQCVRTRLDQQDRTLRFSVGEVRDYTGKFSNEASEGGFRITQGGTLMVISALGQLGRHVDLLERYDTRIAEQEIALAKNQLVQDQGPGGAILRPLTAGQYYGSDYYIVGGVTEANYSISSGGAEVRVDYEIENRSKARIAVPVPPRTVTYPAGRDLPVGKPSEGEPPRSAQTVIEPGLTVGQSVSVDLGQNITETVYGMNPKTYNESTWYFVVGGDRVPFSF